MRASQLLRGYDPNIAAAIAAEEDRQFGDLELIASENYVSPAVLIAVGSVLTNKYAEGQAGKRYYGGCGAVDVVERTAEDRGLQLFGLDPAEWGLNVQPHSGAQANAAMYFAAIKPGDKILGLDLSNGGHLTHGSPFNISGVYYKAFGYHVTADGFIDMGEVRDIARRERPQLIMTGGSAYPRFWDFAAFAEIAEEVGAILVADIAHIAGMVAVQRHPSPFPYCRFVTSTTHKTLRGPRGGIAFGRTDDMKNLNYAVFPGTQGGPLMHVIAGKACAFGEALKPSFATYIDGVLANAQTMAESLIKHGFSLVSGGTDNHLMLVDLSGRDYSGKEAERVLGRAGITVNKNTVPGEKRSPFVTSGLRIGTPAMTTRGCGVEDARLFADWIAEALEFRKDEGRLANIRGRVHELMNQRPVPGLSSSGADTDEEAPHNPS